LREQISQAEGGTGLFTRVAFLGAAAVGTLALLLPGPEIAAAISSDDILGTTYFVVRGDRTATTAPSAPLA